MKVPLLDLSIQHQNLREELRQAIDGVMDSQQFILGSEVTALEHELAEYCHSRFAIGCASGSDALLLALMALDIKPGDEIITTPFSFFATVSAITRLGAKPVFIDIDPQTYNLDVSRIEEKLTDRTRAIMPVHLFGQCADMKELMRVAGKNGIPVIEDAAQAIGSEEDGARAGSMGAIGCFSFYPSKNLGAAGDGGLLTAQNEEVARKLHMLRVHGAEKTYQHQYVGINSRLDSLQAAILRVKLRELDSWTEARQKNAAFYRELFGDYYLDDRVVLPLERKNFYLICGFLAAAGQIVMDTNSAIPMLGASGAISGVLGGYILLFPHNRVRGLIFNFLTTVPAFVALGLWIGYQLLASYLGGGEGGVAYAAHIGGFLGGLALIKIFAIGTGGGEYIPPRH